MTTYPLRRLKLRLGDEHREPVTIALQPFDLGGERTCPVPAEADAAFEAQRAASGDVFRLVFRRGCTGPACGACRTPSSTSRSTRASTTRRPTTRPTTSDPSTSSTGSSSSRSGRATRSRPRFPTQILCRRDCAGLCPVCGKDLNDEPHVHEETVADPRWAALEALREE